MNESRFGIEIETCVKDVNTSEFDEESDYSTKFSDHYVDNLNKILKKNHIGDRFVNHFLAHKDKSGRFIGNTNWYIDNDDSVDCEVEYEDDKKKLKFFPIEMVTRVFDYDSDSIEIFEKVYREAIMSDGFIYLDNQTQGLHITISHPLQNAEHFLKFFWYFEPFIMGCLPIFRRTSDYAVSLRKMFGRIRVKDFKGDPSITIEDIIKYAIEKKSFDTSAVNLRKKNGEIYAFEIRVINSNVGSYRHHINWVHFLIHLLWASITKTIDVRVNLEMSALSEKMFDLLEIPDNLKLFFMDLYREHSKIL